MVSKGFYEYVFQPCIFSWRRKNNFVIIGLYVDDILIIGNSKEKIDSLKRELSEEFEMKDLGSPKQFLGIDIEVKNFEISLSVKSSIEKMLKTFNMENCKPKKTSGDTSSRKERERKR